MKAWSAGYRLDAGAYVEHVLPRLEGWRGCLVASLAFSVPCCIMTMPHDAR